tara:strand:+ start:302 stop:682 length:381 start_codon:yes stop_codon:yes gene_type:complete
MSTIKAANVQNTGSGAPTFKNSSGTEIGQLCRVWVSFSGSGTPSINDDFNVSSITDNGTGRFIVNYASAMANNDYACLMTTQAGLSAYGFGTGDNSITTSDVEVFCITNGGGLQDVSHCSVAIFGD